jgi:hypothetical protein
MRKKPTRLSARAWIAIVAGVIVVAFVAVDLGRRESPGELTQVHGVDADLDGRWDCASCHGGFRSSMTDSCLKCHAPIAAQLDAHAGLHGVLAADKAKQCSSCHSEHHGAAFKMVNARSFAAAGVADVAVFDHQLVGWRMDGRHLEVECAKCHKDLDVASVVKDQHRYGGLSRDCVTCHQDKDVHQGKMALGCAACHDQTDWKRFAYPGHEKFLALVGPHANVDCRKCHAKGEKQALEHAGREATPAARECRDCHDSPHAKPLVAATAAFAKTSEAQACAECHKADQMKFREPGLTLTAAEHARSGFPIGAPHDKVQCAQCHAPDLEKFAARYPGRREDDCAACHRDVHGGQFATGPFAAGGCIACHDKLRFKPTTFDLAKHALASLPLEGRHAEVECNTCHRVPKAKGAKPGVDGKPVDPPRVYRGMPDGCDACHSDAHSGKFDAIAATLPKYAHGDCARCHDAKSFSNLPANGFDHLKWTRFPLLQAHEAATCESCHARAPKADRVHRSFGRVAERWGPVEGCAPCHHDPHGGQFDRKEVPAAVGERRGCERCHDESSWRALRGEFDHGRWTGLALVDGHQLACAQCHAPRAKPDADGKTSDRAKGGACAACHEDVHRGQFLRGGRNDCERCHKSTANFSVLVFKHNLHSRFPLDETHSAVQCADCHKPVAIEGARAVRYRPLGMQCADCHTAPTDPLRRRKGKPG